MANLAPLNCCTDPDNDQNNTNGWGLFGPYSTTISSVTGGVTGYRLKGVEEHPVPWGPAFATSEFSLFADLDVTLQFSIYTAVGTGNVQVAVYSAAFGKVWTNSYDGLGDDIPITIDTSFTPSNTSDDYIIYALGDDPANPIYIDNVYIGQLTTWDNKINSVTKPAKVYGVSNTEASYKVNKINTVSR